jgi:outer membrane receptor protein involved in Fe transport
MLARRPNRLFPVLAAAAGLCAMNADRATAAPARPSAAPARPSAAPAEPSPRGAAAPASSPTQPDTDLEVGDLEVGGEDDLLQKAIVQSATKSRTTVAEAPAVIHIVTATDIERFGHRHLLHTLLYTPGFLEVNAQYDQVPMWTVRGVNQAVLYLRDGLSMFDPVYNVVSSMRRVPVETIKRIEAMTSPGGVLWGANSYLGIVNVITKGARDVNGVELGMGGGHGPGDEMVIRPYLMYGQSFFDGALNVFAHWSLEWFKGPRYSAPEVWLYSPPPRVPGPLSYRYPGGIESSQPTSFYSVFDGKLSYEAKGGTRELMLAWQITFHKMPNLIQSAMDKKWRYWDGIHRPLGFLGGPQGTSPGYPALQRNRINWHESYAFLRYKDRFWKNRFGLNLRGYYIRFHRKFSPTVIFPSTEAVLPGLAFKSDVSAHRSGGTVDFDLQATSWLKLLAGGEVFYEWLENADVTFVAPLTENGQLDFSKVSTTCPFYNRDGSGIPRFSPGDPNQTTYRAGCRQPFIFDSDRLVYALFLSAQVRPFESLILDGGVRFQHAPLGNTPYAPVVLGSAAAVWNIWKEIFFKVNYATGFRPPVFNNTAGNGAAVQYAGNPDIEVEKSQAWQVELNTKILKNAGRIRQWGLRLNYSYTILENLIRILQGRYANSTERAIHAVEFFSDLYLEGGHRLTVSYTWARQWGASELDGGVFRSVPNHWFTAAGAFKILQRGHWQLWANTTLRVIGAFEDPNRTIRCSSPTNCAARSSDLDYDRIPAAAVWNLGLRARGRIAGKLVELSANLYNALDGRYHASDTFYDLGARVEVQPTPAPRLYFFLKARTTL